MNYKDINAILLIILCYGIVGFAAYALLGHSSGTAPAAMATTTPAAIIPNPLDSATGFLFQCDGGLSLKADFGNATVNLVLSDGRRVSLPQAISADGARYANPDESFVFWNKGNGALIQEYGKTTYINCVTQQ